MGPGLGIQSSYSGTVQCSATVLHYTALHCIALYCTELHCSTIYCSAIQCNTAQYNPAHFSAVQCRRRLYGQIRHQIQIYRATRFSLPSVGWEKFQTSLDYSEYWDYSYNKYYSEYPKLDTRISRLRPLSFVRNAQTNPTGFWNRLDWRALVKDLSPQLAKLRE